MIVPAAMDIYSGAAMLKEMPEQWREDQHKELRSAMPTLVREYGVDQTSFEDGYEMGLATARTILQGSVELRLKGCDPEKIL
jgi:hypothetical protein